VDNTVEAFVKIATANNVVGEVFNAGSGREVSIKELVEIISKVTGTKIKVVQDKKRFRPDKSEVERLICDSTKIQDKAGWNSDVSLEKGIAKTFSWLKSNIKSYKPGIYNV